MGTYPDSDYPGAIDGEFPARADGDPIPATDYAGLVSALLAVENELGTDPSGAYASVKARLAALDGRVFDVVAYGAVVDGATDDTAAVQAAINACGAAGGGVVTSSKPGVSVIAGALQDTSGANAQITLPQVSSPTGECVPLVICGPFAPAVLPSVIGATPVPDNHWVLKSTLASGTGAVIGAVGPSGTFANFTAVTLTMRDVSVRTVANPTITALDLRHVQCVDLRRVLVDTGSFDVDGLAQPSSSGSFGIRLPTNNNGATATARDVHVVGFYTGLEHSEHGILDNVTTWGCRVGYQPTAANHASHYGRVMAVHCTTPIKPTGAHALDIEQLDIEHADSTQGWRQTTYDIDDPSNYLSGFVRWWAVLANSGVHNSFVKNGGTNVTASRIGDAIGTGGGSATYFRKDRLTAAGGETGVNLGATPVADSVLVWVNAAVKWQGGVDYTISGSSITFGSALTAGQVVTIHYATTTASPSAASFASAGVDIADDFNRANTTNAIGSTSTGAKAWSQVLGTWGITSNQAYESSYALATNIAVVESGVADCTVSVKIGSNGSYSGLVFRSDGTTANGIFVQYDDVSKVLNMLKKVGGVQTSIGTPASVTLALTDVVAVVLSGSSITVKVNGVTKISVTETDNATRTKHGIWSYGAAGSFDDFSIQP